MRAFAILVLPLVLVPEAEGADYMLGVDSHPQEGVPQGTVTKHIWDDSRIYPGATHEYWIYVPAQYNDAESAAVMVFQDGQGYVSLEGPVRAPTVFDNLIHKGEMPLTIGVFINPGQPDEPRDQRAAQYVPLDDTYARFLLEEILPEVGKTYNLVDDAAGRAICGMSDGGLAAFTAAWERPDAFSKVVSHVGSYTRLRGGSEYPYLIRRTRENTKPIRVFIQGGMNDINLTEGSWTLANLAMGSALQFARYDHRIEMGSGGHNLLHGGAIFPNTLRWLWRDYPGVKGAGDAPVLDDVVGVWDVVTNMVGQERRSVLTVSAENGELVASLNDEKDGEIRVTSVGFEDGILTYEYVEPKSPWDGTVDDEDKDDDKAANKDADDDKVWTGEMSTWAIVSGNTFEGAATSRVKTVIDYSTKGTRRNSPGTGR
ncbi:MAG: hypothetical protein F4X98_02165 [Gammaproteobacteria bacterium]|nr:hypothetical protein [Gammaproteobacteria bacterium]